ncbi:MAG TPA: hypothetical protein VJS92_00350, partial [Candidatus Polarisedimenticolaceae bacterium]|nr:hypothetical protein [Candidatus Polarisedimenticolaceae bacterium]
RAVAQGELAEDQPLRQAVGRRLAAGGLDRRAYRRVYNALLRAGFEAERIRAELEPHRTFPDDDDDLA